MFHRGEFSYIIARIDLKHYRFIIVSTFMPKELIAKAQITIDAPAEKVWEALTDPAIIKEYMFGADVVTDWEVGSSIVWKGEWEGKPFEDKGKIVEIQEEKMMHYTHYSPMTGEEDKPENYHNVIVKLSEKGGETTVTLTQDGSSDEKERAQSEKNWKMMMKGLKKVVESE